MWKIVVAPLMLSAAVWAMAETGTVAGRVVGPGGDAVPNAQVFIEPDLGAALLRAASDEQGRFEFDDAPHGRVGLFAIAEGYAFGGQTVTVAVEDRLTGLTVRLGRPGQVSGVVRNADGDSIEGVRFTRVALLGADSVGIPLAKLQSYGFEEPRSGSGGQFRIAHLPEGGRVALKLGHPQYAQEGMDDVAVGSERLTATMHRGVLVRGSVQTRFGRDAVSGAMVRFANAQPPHDSALARSDGQGEFALRLKPGVYLARAETGDYASPGWENVTVTGEQSQVQVALRVGRRGWITGEVRDARTESPIRGARLELQADGRRAAVVRTGATGRFRAEASEGENIIILAGAEGYMQPVTSSYRVNLREGQAVELPTFWMAPLPSIPVTVQDQRGEPVPGAVVTLHQPPQMGWYLTEDAGDTTLRFGSLSQEEAVFGFAEHPNDDTGAFFAIDPGGFEDVRVELEPLGRVTGRVTNERGRAAPSAVVAAMFQPDPDAAGVVLWRGVTDRDGAFSWPAAPLHAPLRLVAIVDDDASGASTMFQLTSEERSKEIGVSVDGARPGRGRPPVQIDWTGFEEVSGGGAPRVEEPAATVLFFTQANAAEAAGEALAKIQTVLRGRGVQCVLVITDGGALDASPVRMARGEQPGRASGYVLDRENAVQYAGMGIPPLWAVKQALTSQAEE